MQWKEKFKKLISTANDIQTFKGGYSSRQTLPFYSPLI